MQYEKKKRLKKRVEKQQDTNIQVLEKKSNYFLTSNCNMWGSIFCSRFIWHSLCTVLSAQNWQNFFSPCSTSIKIPDQIKHQWLWATWSSKRCSCPQQNKMVFKSPFQPNTYYDSMPWRINAHWLKDDGRRGLIVVGTAGQGCATGCPADSGKHYKAQQATVFLSHF